ncbi:OapC/ArvC family zinc-ribbon domain-containing protein [Halocatena halophila]|uniref:OapC/ArvC family zinc-ribbon domain-containing protein n=1 Tax=Halocatena halophila TaxID=2814576 RepID=UPI002ED09322
MAHQCTNCGCVFGDGSKEMLSGCPDCGGTTFQFRPEDSDEDGVTEEPPQPRGGAVGTHVGRATSMMRELMTGQPTESSDTADTEQSESASASPEQPEDSAQAMARSEFVHPDQLPETDDSPPTGPSPPPSDGRVIREPTGEQPDLAELRAELNDQFESIKILEPGQYELNLMELYGREEYIIALQENGHYVIQMPETWLSNEN